ncbi:MAG TPA: FAD-dependent oxidoreductase [Puia sp.]|jgi:hypothetical protein
MTQRFRVETYEVPVYGQPDVCVIGAGASGVAAAVAAARLNLSVWLVEKYGFSGGATVAGLSGTICGLYSSGVNPEQIVFGFADEFYRALKDRDGVVKPVPFGKTRLLPHDSLKWKETADEILLTAGCRILYHTHFLKAFTDAAGKVTALLLKGQEGQFVIQPRFVIDASGDAEAVHSIAGPTSVGNNGLVQTPTMIFKMANVDMKEFLALDPSALNRMVAAADQGGDYQLPRHHVYIFPLPNSGEVLCNMTRITGKDGRIPMGTNSEDMSFAEMEGRRQAREYARFLVDCVAAFAGAYMSDTGVQVGIRQTRSIVGKERLLNADVIGGRKNKNAVTFSAWPIEMHGADGVRIHYLEDDYYDIPFETLIPRDAVNLLVAGRCMSAEHEALASARVTAQCFGMGYAAGAACGLMRRENITASGLNGMMVRDWMKQNNLKCADEQ